MDSKNSDLSFVKSTTIELIRNYLGEETARLYSNFYQDSADETVLNSISELLLEYFGKQKADEILIKSGLIKSQNE